MLVVTINRATRFEFRNADGSLGSIEVAAIGTGRVRLALDFPRAVEIWRGENAERIAEARASGAKPNGKSER